MSLRSFSLFDVVLELFIFLSSHLINFFFSVFHQVGKKFGSLSLLLWLLLEISFTCFLPELIKTGSTSLGAFRLINL